jgi:hypothetical protein
MASVKRGGGKGTYTENGVVCTMGAPFNKAARAKEGVGGGQYNANKAPFEKPASMGGGGIPTKFFDGMSAKAATTSNAGASSVIGITKRNPSERRFKTS